MERKKLKAEARKLISPRLGSLLSIILIIWVVDVICSAVGPAGATISLIILGPISLSLAFIFLEVAKNGKKSEIKDLLIGFKEDNVIQAIFAALRYVGFTFLWSLLFFIPGIIKSISYSQMFYLMADKKLNAKDAQLKSMEIMNGHKWDYFVLQLSFIPWYLLVTITFGVAIIYVGPYVETAEVMFYKSLLKDKKKA